MTRPQAEKHHQDEEYIRSILDRVDRQEEVASRANRRAAPRHSYRKYPVQTRIIQPGGGTVQCVTATREISATGLSFLHRGFLYAGTDVRLLLQRRAGGEEFVEGTVTWCRHVAGPYHLIGMKFRQRIYPKLFVEMDLSVAEDATSQPDHSTLKGSVLLVDDQELDRMLVMHYAAKTALKIQEAADAASAIEIVKLNVFDLILCDLNLGETTGEELIRQFRSRKINCPIIALTAENSTSRLQAAQKAGATVIVQKPYDPQHLLGVIGHLLSQATGPQAGEEIFSDMAGKPGADALILQCIDKVRKLSAELEQSAHAKDFTRVRALCQTLKGNGSGFGFATLSEAAKLAVTSLDASMSVEESVNELQKLISICRRLSPGKPASK